MCGPFVFQASGRRMTPEGCVAAGVGFRPAFNGPCRWMAFPMNARNRNTAPVEVQDWWSGGEVVPLELSGTEQGVFVRREGSGPSMTLLHGFPSSSHDWAKIAPALAERYALTMPDLLGFGASSKPREHRYSLLEQADLVEALWEHEGIESTVVVAHDYSVSVAQEFLTRRAAGTLAVDLRALHFINGGIYPDLHRPQPTQVALLDHGARAADKRRDERRGVHGRPRADVPGGVRLDCRRRRDLAELPPAQRTEERASPDPLHRGPPRARRALDAGTPDDRRAAHLRVGNARPGLRRAHGRAHPRATPGRTVHGAGGRCALATARGTGARGGRATGPAALETSSPLSRPALAGLLSHGRTGFAVTRSLV